MALPELRGKSNILELYHVEELSKELPPRAEGYAWTLAFTTSQMGFSLKSLYRSLSNNEGPVLLVIKDTERHIFGAFCSCNLQPSESFYGTGETYLFSFIPRQSQFQQQQQQQLASGANNRNNIKKNNNNNYSSIDINASSTISRNSSGSVSNSGSKDSVEAQQPQLMRFPWTGDNQYFIKGDSDSLVIGAGEGNFGLWLDEDLYHGTTHSCKTFNNLPLTSKEDFVIVALECWIFL